MKRSEFLFLSAAGLQSGKPFELMAGGEFIDALGRDVAITTEHLTEFAENTSRELQRMRLNEGEDFAGLPIEGRGHWSGDAYGWITDVYIENDVVMAMPDWNKDGIETLENATRRYVSPEANFRTMTIVAAALTNFPATRDPLTDLPLMKPIALSETRFTYAMDTEPVDPDPEKSMLERLSRGIEKLNKLFENNPMFPNDDDSNMDQNPLSKDGLNMNKKVTALLESLSDKEKAEFATALISGVIDGDEIAASVGDATKTSLEGVGAMVKSRVDTEVALEMRKLEAVSLSVEMVGGSVEIPHGLPVEADEMEKFLLSLNAEQYEVAKTMFSAIRENGLVDFEEAGADDPDKSEKKQLSAPMKAVLRNSMSTGATVAEFFEINKSDLGEMSEYDLAEFEAEKE